MYGSSLSKCLARVREIHNARQISLAIAPGASLASVLREAAGNETDETLTDMWARLIANVTDPKKTSLIRPSFVTVLKAFDPLDLQILELFVTFSPVVGPSAGMGGATTDFNSFASRARSNSDALIVSLERLTSLHCLEARNKMSETTQPVFSLAPLGRLLLAALER